MNRAELTRPGLTALWILEISVCVVLPALALVYVFGAVAGDARAIDFETALYGAADALRHGDSPYPEVNAPIVARGIAYVYPPLVAILTIPFTLLSVEAAGVVAMALLACGVAGTLFLLGVRDWRCYGIAYAWPPVYSAIQTGNLTILLGLCAALAWRFRHRAWVGGASVGLALALKLFLWPLVVWQAAVRRFAAAVASLLVGAVLVFVSWAAIGFIGLLEYPDLLRRLQEVLKPEAFTVYALALDLGASTGVAQALWIAVGVALLIGVLLLARRGDEQGSFVLALAAALALTPLVWLHYFALLLVAVAVAQPTLGAVWFVPLAMYLSTATHNGTTFQTVLTLAVAALTVALALRPGPLRRVERDRAHTVAMTPAAGRR